MGHEMYMHRCIELAKNGLGSTYPNPLVGSVVVYKDTIIGEGWHRKSGGAHAEVNTIGSVADKTLLEKSTLYVNLEPCSHFGKTPPCSDMIIAYGIPKVIIGGVDTNEKVGGKGIEKLRSAGIEVIVGVLEKECRELNRRFFTFHEKRRPYIILKWAETPDGFIAPGARENQAPVWISNQYSRQLVHKWRSEEHAILVGTTTAMVDNPRLDVRDWDKKNQPIRLVIDKRGEVPMQNHIFDNQLETIVFSQNQREPAGGNTHFEVVDFGHDILPQITRAMFRRQIQSVIVEGGRHTLQSFIDQRLWDEARIFIGGANLGSGTKAPEIDRKNAQKTRVGNDELLIFGNL